MLINNRYQVIRPLGEGGFGHAYLAEDTQMPSSRRCVIKQLKPQAAGTASSAVYKVVQERFQREAAILEKIGENHPQIPRLYAYFTENQKFYLVQEWIDGTTLEEILATQGPQSESKVRSLLGSLLPVLDFIHKQGLIHRDLKPDNIILRTGLSQSSGQKNTENTLGQPVLIDFGAVRETMGTMMNSHNSLTSTIVIGTPGYMPSEQAAGRPLPSSDLYSLGLTAIYALTGRSPQELESDPQTGEVIWRDFVAHVSPDLVEVIDKAARSHPRDRYSSAAQMLSGLSGNVHTSNAEASEAVISPESTALPKTTISPVPLTANQVNRPTYQQPEQGTQVVSPLASPPASSSAANNTFNNPDQTVLSGGVLASDNSSTRRLSPVIMGLMAAAVGAGAIGGGLLVSRSAGDSSLQAPPIQAAASSPEESSTTPDTSDSNSPEQGSDAATKEEARTTQLSSKVQSTEGVRSAEISLSDTRMSSPPAGQPESAVTPDNPDESAFGYPVFFREDLRRDRVNVYARVDDRGEPLHYGLPGDRVTLLDQVNRPDTIWNLVRFESGAEGWVPQEVIAWDQAPPVEETVEEIVEAIGQNNGSQQPAYGWLAGIAPGNQVDVYPAPMFDPGPEHYGLVGDRVAILDSAKGYDDGLIWYRVAFDSGAVGWVRNDFIELP